MEDIIRKLVEEDSREEREKIGKQLLEAIRSSRAEEQWKQEYTNAMRQNR